MPLYSTIERQPASSELRESYTAQPLPYTGMEQTAIGENNNKIILRGIAVANQLAERLRGNSGLADPVKLWPLDEHLALLYTQRAAKMETENAASDAMDSEATTAGT
jgi:hypothetical protein